MDSYQFEVIKNNLENLNINVQVLINLLQEQKEEPNRETKKRGRPKKVQTDLEETEENTDILETDEPEEQEQEEEYPKFPQKEFQVKRK